MSETFTMWRCVECGKWSHAARQPKQHQRWVPYGTPASEPDPATVIRFDPGWSSEFDEGDRGGWAVRCGPFAEYRAQAVTS